MCIKKIIILLSFSLTAVSGYCDFNEEQFQGKKIGFECRQPDFQTGVASVDKMIKEQGQYRLVFEEISVTPIMNLTNPDGSSRPVPRGRFVVRVYDQNAASQNILFTAEGQAKKLIGLIDLDAQGSGKKVEVQILETEPLVVVGDVGNRVGITFECAKGIYALDTSATSNDSAELESDSEEEIENAELLTFFSDQG